MNNDKRPGSIASQQAHQYEAYLQDPSTAPHKVAVQKVPLSAQQKSWIENAWALLDSQHAIDLDVDLVNIFSPTGFEKEINHFIVDYWKRAGVQAFYQQMDEHQGNGVARLIGEGDGPTLFLCCPIDSHWTGKLEDDGLQWGDPMRRDNTQPAVVEGQTIIGLGSSNDKGAASSIMMAVEALHRANVPLQGTLIASTLAGGAPALSPDDEPRKNIGFCQGLIHALCNGQQSDYALLHKPGHHVSWEEPGMCFFRIRIHGNPDYMATENRADDGTDPDTRAPYRVFTDTARILSALDAAAKEYRQLAKAGTFKPAMAVGAVRAGAPNKPNWSTAISEVFLDIRPAPWTAPIEIKYWFDALMLDIISSHPGMKVDWEMTVSLPGGRTDPNNWIIQSSIRAVQALEGVSNDEYEGSVGGQTEAGMLRNWGIPTARISGGPPNPELPEDLKPGFTMSGAYAPHLIDAAKVLIYIAVDTLTRSREETGLPY
ncbi:MAG: acetylornithine deacetylase/succinyl-diaminopimelate desuccinylase-like protein [Gammaproteobacteria bacterium]|jgi:acetylornithine deacetylase/succinyl-diaminopimelate desuccinylase-like protein